MTSGLSTVLVLLLSVDGPSVDAGTRPDAGAATVAPADVTDDEVIAELELLTNLPQIEHLELLEAVAEPSPRN